MNLLINSQRVNYTISSPKKLNYMVMTQYVDRMVSTTTDAKSKKIFIGVSYPIQGPLDFGEHTFLRIVHDAEPESARRQATFRSTAERSHRRGRYELQHSRN